MAYRSCSMEVLLVRAVEKALDAVDGKLEQLCWNAPLSKADGLVVLQVIPRLIDVHFECMHMPSRAASGYRGYCHDAKLHRLCFPFFSLEHICFCWL